MSARTKLNGFVLTAVLLCAALLGGATHSWLIFVAVAIVGTILMIHSGEVRLRARDGRLTSQSERPQ